MDSSRQGGELNGVPASSLRTGELFDFPIGRPAEVYRFGKFPPSVAKWLEGSGFPKQGELRGIDRLGQAIYSAGFVPHSKTEVDNMVLANKHPGTTGGFARALNTVLLHNKGTNSEDPAAALRLKVGQVGGYLKNSRLTLAKLDDILESLVRASVGEGFMSMSQDGQEAREKWLAEVFEAGYNRGGLAAMIRTMAVKNGLDMGEEIDLDKVPTQELSWDEVKVALSQLNPAEFLNILEQTALSEISRQEFWQNRLSEAKNHGSVKAQVLEILKTPSEA